MELRISRDISEAERNLIALCLSRICSVQDVMLRRLEVLQASIDSTVQKMETIGKQVDALESKLASQEMNLPPSLSPGWLEELMASEPSPTIIPERISSPDITCYETIFDANPPSPGQMFPSNGTGVPQVQVSLDMHMNNCPMLTSRTQGQSGGTGINWNQK